MRVVMLTAMCMLTTGCWTLAPNDGSNGANLAHMLRAVVLQQLFGERW